jgi:hypothetical protein
MMGAQAISERAGGQVRPSGDCYRLLGETVHGAGGYCLPVERRRAADTWRLERC